MQWRSEALAATQLLGQLARPASAPPATARDSAFVALSHQVMSLQLEVQRISRVVADHETAIIQLEQDKDEGTIDATNVGDSGPSLDQLGRRIHELPGEIENMLLQHSRVGRLVFLVVKVLVCGAQQKR